MLRFGKFEKQLFAAFLALGILLFALPMTSIMFANVLASQAQHRSTAAQSVESRMRFSNLCFSSAFSLIYDLSSYGSIRAFGESAAGSGDYYYHATRIMEDMKSVFAPNLPVEFDVAVTRTDVESFVITPRATLSKNDYFSLETTLDVAETESIIQHFRTSTTALTVPVYREGVLSDLYYIMCRVSAGTDCLIFLRIPVQDLFGDSVPYLIFAGDTTTVYSQQTEELMQIAKTLVQHRSGAQGQIQFSLEGKDVYFEEFTSNAWEVAFLYPDTGKSFASLIAMGAVVFLGLGALIALAALLLTKALYHPMRQTLQEALPSGVTLNSPEALDEFAVLRQNTSRLTQLSQQINHLMEEQKEMRVIRHAHALLFGLETSKVIEADFCVGLIEIKTDSEAVLFRDKAVIEGCVAQLAAADFVNCSSETAAVILRTNSPQKARDLMEGILGSCHSEADFYATISDIFNGSDKINLCYKQCLQILEYKYLFAECDILTMEQVKQMDSKMYYYPLNIEKSFVQYLVTGGDGGLILFDELVEENLSNRKLPPEIVKNFLFALIASVSRAFQTIKLSPVALIGRELNFESLIRRWHEPTCLTELRQIVVDMQQAVQQRAQTADQHLLEQMQSYIHSNFAQDIMLEDLAHQFKISSKYCSALFKKLSGDTFKNYLNRYRIDQAKDKIRATPTIKISNLASCVGFNSSNSFIRVFNKYTGETPKAFAEAVGSGRSV